MKRPAIIVVCLAALIVLATVGYYLLHRGPAASDSMPGAAPPLLSLLPPQAPYVIYADVAALRNSAFLNRLMALAPTSDEDPEYADFVRSTGFDYSRDLDRVAIAIFPTAPIPTVSIFAEGRFDQQKIIDYALRSGKTEVRDGRKIYVLPSSTPGGEVTLRIVAANRIELTSNPQGNSSMPANNSDPTGAELKQRINRVAGSPLFAAIRMDAVPKDARIGSFRIDVITGAMRGVQWLTLSAVPQGQDLRAVVDGECESSAHANVLGLALGGLRAMAKELLAAPGTRKQLTPQGSDALLQLVRTTEISSGNRNVVLAVSFTPQILDGLAAPSPAPRQQVPAKAPPGTARPAH
jgi:hypothetical protein